VELEPKPELKPNFLEKNKGPTPGANQRLTSSYPLVLIQVIQNKLKTESDY
jgi:hypothetical protein